MLGRLTVRGKIIGIFVCILVYVILSVGTSIVMIQEISRASSEVFRNPFDVSLESAVVMGDMVALDRNLKDFILENDEDRRLDMIETMDIQDEKVSQQLIQIREGLTEDEAIQRITDIETIFKEWGEFRTHVIGLVLSERRSEAAVLTQSVGVAYIEVLEEKGDELHRLAQRKVEELIVQAEKVHTVGVRKLVWMLVSLSLVFGSLLFGGIRSIIHDLL